jgi:predicted transcriptional regulator
MALTYDLENDIRFKQGIEKGIKKGIEKEKIAVIQALLAEKMSIDKIAKITQTSATFVKKIADNLSK